VGADVSSARTLIVGENEKAERRRQVQVFLLFAAFVDLGNEILSCRAFGERYLVHGVPEGVFQADTTNSPRNVDGPNG
jgi:hypothetical protein